MKSRGAMLSVLAASAVGVAFAQSATRGADEEDVIYGVGDDRSDVVIEIGGFPSDALSMSGRQYSPAVKTPNPERERQAAERRARKIAKQAKGFVA